MVNKKDKISEYMAKVPYHEGSGKSYNEIILEAIRFGESLNNTITIDRNALERLIKASISLSLDGTLHYDEIFEIIKKDFGINL